MDFRLLNSAHRESESKLPLHVTQHPPPTSEPSTRIRYSSASWISYPAWGHTIGSARVGPIVETGYSFPGVAHAWTIFCSLSAFSCHGVSGIRVLYLCTGELSHTCIGSGEDDRAWANASHCHGVRCLLFFAFAGCSGGWPGYLVMFGSCIRVVVWNGAWGGFGAEEALGRSSRGVRKAELRPRWVEVHLERGSILISGAEICLKVMIVFV
jgi:hypothetical protein